MNRNSLYKLMSYRPNGDGFFDNFLIRLSSRYSMNDPFEILPSETSLIRFIQQEFPGSLGHTDLEISKSPTFINTINQEQAGKRIDLFDRTGAICLTETKRNLLMWSHYADSHRGFVIELDTNHAFFNRPADGNNYNGKIHRVRYDRERPKDVNQWLEWFIHKSDEWIYEKEHRFLFSLHHADECYKLEAGSKQIFDPARTQDIYKSEYICLLKIPKDAIISVSFGVKMLQEHKEKIIEKARQDNELSHIKIYESTICKERYDLIFNEIQHL